jgi:4-hydroxybenzoyl-CoA thioesterase
VVEHTISVQARWRDVDPAGIAFYPRFFEWYDLAAEALFETLGLPWPELFAKYDIVGVPILESGSHFTAPVRWGDTVAVRAMVAWVKDRTFRMEYEVSNEAGLCARGFEVRAWVARLPGAGDRRAARPIPEEVARRLREG